MDSVTFGCDKLPLYSGKAPEERPGGARVGPFLDRWKSLGMENIREPPPKEAVVDVYS